MFKTPTSDQLRYDGQLAYRDGRIMRARKLNAMADNLDRYPAAAAADLARIAALGAEGALVITRRQPSFCEAAVDTGGTVAACLTLASAVALCWIVLWFAASADTASAFDGSPYAVTADR
jgi:hypothetical protein